MISRKITPAVEPSVTSEFAEVQVLNLASGSTPLELLGASAIHSALLSTQDEAEQVCVVEKLLAEWVESVTFNV